MLDLQQIKMNIQNRCRDTKEPLFVNTCSISSPESPREELLLKIEAFDFDAQAGDVAPFLITKGKTKRVVKFREFWKRVELD